MLKPSVENSKLSRSFLSWGRAEFDKVQVPVGELILTCGYC